MSIANVQFHAHLYLLSIVKFNLDIKTTKESTYVFSCYFSCSLCRFMSDRYDAIIEYRPCLIMSL